MTDTINPNPPDQLAKMEELLRGVGAWADVQKLNVATHYYIARNPSINTAISLCRSSIQSFDKLALTTPVNKCMVCDLFAQNRLKEVSEDIKYDQSELPQVKDQTYVQLTFV